MTWEGDSTQMVSQSDRPVMEVVASNSELEWGWFLGRQRELGGLLHAECEVICAFAKCGGKDKRHLPYV